MRCESCSFVMGGIWTTWIAPTWHHDSLMALRSSVPELLLDCHRSIHRWDDIQKHCFANISDALFQYFLWVLGKYPLASYYTFDWQVMTSTNNSACFICFSEWKVKCFVEVHSSFLPHMYIMRLSRQNIFVNVCARRCTYLRNGIILMTITFIITEIFFA